MMLYAVSDSWSRYPNGILVGTTHHMGVYDECVNVHRPVQGKYCIPSVKLGSSNGVDFTVGKPDQLQSIDHAWREILGVSRYDRIFRRYHNNQCRKNTKNRVCSLRRTRATGLILYKQEYLKV